MRDRIRQGDSEGGEAYDAAYHYAVAEATHNNLLIKLLRTVHEEWSKAVSAGSQQLLVASEKNSQKVMDQHTRVFEAIKARDPVTASKAMLEHVTFAEKEIRKHFTKVHQKKLDAYLKLIKSQGNIQVLEKLTTLVGKDRKIVNFPPLIEHFSAKTHGVPLINLIDKALLNYSSTLLADRKVLFGRYALKDFARKVVGIGSVGTNCMVLYFEGDGPRDALFLQYKEAQKSVLSPYLGESIYADMGRRVVSGQRLLQGAPDIFLNYGAMAYDIDNTQGFYLRQLRDMKGGIQVGGVGGVSLKNFPDYGRLFGWALALGHARSGDAALIAGYCGQSKHLDAALYSFAKSYAKQNRADYEVFCNAVKDGRLKVAHQKTAKNKE